MIIGGVYAYLAANSTINNAVSGRIRPTAADQNDPRPHIEIRVVNTEGSTHLEGNSKVYTSLVTIDVTSNQSLEADTIAMNCLESGIVGYRGTLGGVVFHGVDIDEGLIQYDQGVEPGSDARVYVSSFTLEIVWSKAPA